MSFNFEDLCRPTAEGAREERTAAIVTVEMTKYIMDSRGTIETLLNDLQALFIGQNPALVLWMLYVAAEICLDKMRVIPEAALIERGIRENARMYVEYVQHMHPGEKPSPPAD